MFSESHCSARKALTRKLEVEAAKQLVELRLDNAIGGGDGSGTSSTSTSVRCRKLSRIQMGRKS